MNNKSASLTRALAFSRTFRLTTGQIQQQTFESLESVHARMRKAGTDDMRMPVQYAALADFLIRAAAQDPTSNCLQQYVGEIQRCHEDCLYERPFIGMTETR